VAGKGLAVHDDFLVGYWAIPYLVVAAALAHEAATVLAQKGFDLRRERKRRHGSSRATQQPFAAEDDFNLVFFRVFVRVV